MANSVDLVIGTEAIKQVESLISKLSLADAELLKISQSAMGASKGISGISTPSGLDKTVTNNANLNAQLEKQNDIINKLHADIAKKAEQSRLAEIQLQQAREKAFDSYSAKLAKQSIAEEKASQKAIQATTKQQLAEEKQALARRTAFDKNSQKLANETSKELSAYNRIQTSVTLLTKTYNDLAIRKELGNTLSKNEEKQLDTLSGRINQYQSALLKVDSQIGKNQRNVGNYASGYNALGNSINQLSREAPAFANSVNTGFMALSNNFPALFDAINGIRDKNKLLVAEGKPTTSVLKSIAGAVLSWQTALSVGVTLLTLYGGKIVDWASQLTKGKESVNELKKSTETLNKAFEDSSIKNAVENVNELAINIQLAKDGFLDKNQVVNQYNDTIGKTTGLVTSLDEAEKELTKNGDAYIKMTLYKAAANLALEEAAKQSLEAEKSRLKSLKEFASVALDADLSQTRSKEQYDLKQKNLQNQLKRRQAEEIKISEDAAKANINIAKKFQTDAAKIAKDFNFNLFGDTKKENEKKLTKAKKEEIEALKGTEKYYEDQISKLKELQSTTADTNEEYKAFTNQIELLIEALNKLKNGNLGAFGKPVLTDTSDEDIPSTFIEDKVDPNEWMKEYKKDSDIWDGHEKLKSDWKETFDSIADSAQQAGDIIAEFSQRNFDNEYARLEAQKDISLKFAGDSAEAKAKIEADYEKKRNEIANRENKAKQKQAIFNIAIDTAQAIMATVGKKGFAGLPLALILGALGAAQIAMVASQKIPQYFDGTDNHIGGMMLVNDGKGANFQEKVILPNGQEIMPEGRNVFMNAPKGTKVLTHEQQIMQMLSERGISMSAKYNQNNGMTANEMDSVMAKHFSKIQTNNTTFDRNGFRSWSESNGNRTIQNNNRVSRTGFSV